MVKIRALSIIYTNLLLELPGWGYSHIIVLPPVSIRLPFGRKFSHTFLRVFFHSKILWNLKLNSVSWGNNFNVFSRNDCCINITQSVFHHYLMSHANDAYRIYFYKIHFSCIALAKLTQIRLYSFILLPHQAPLLEN